MGIDAEIYFECDGEPSDLYLPDGYDFEVRHHADNVWRIYNYARYYGPGYERGPWSVICGVLMSLFASDNVAKIWYFGDSSDFEDVRRFPTTIDDILDISRHYMLNGERPYRHDAPVIK